MKRKSIEIREFYTYDTYEEFEKHYNEMINMGFAPNADSSKPDYYTNREMNSYCAEYYKKI